MKSTLLLASLLAACAPDPGQPFAAPDPQVDGGTDPRTAEPEAPTMGPALELSAGPACEAGHRPLGVRVLDRLVGEPECADAIGCVAPYERFAALPEVQSAAQPYADCGAELQGWYDDRAAGIAPQWNPLAPEPGRATGEQILERSNLGFLFDPDAFWARPLDVVVGQETLRTSGTGTSYRQREVVFTDPLVGDVRALHLLPMGADLAVPTIVVLPGHGEGPEEHRDRRFGQYLPEQGLAALILEFRAWEQPFDHQATVGLLCQGQSMMMLRAYEALLAFKYLEAVEEGCGSRLGLLGHSGGSLMANLLVWLEVTPAEAVVTDLMSGYEGVQEFDGDLGVDCETHEDLAGLAAEINDLSRAPVPVQQVRYGYPTDNTPDWDEPDPDDLQALEHFVPFFREQLGLE